MICFQDKRSLIVQETFNLEKSYVESLQFLVLVRRNKLKPNLLNPLVPVVDKSTTLFARF